MAKLIKAIRGMHDVSPDDTPLWRHVEATVTRVLDAYGYREIRMPILEKTELFARSIGAVTDIVEKEMYTFEDRNGDSLSLRPEGTAGCVRAGLEGGLLHNQVQRLWYRGPMFRHERPQKGRYRQFHQIGVETYGLAGPDIDAELIALSARLWRHLGLDDLRLEINSLGTAAARADYRQVLVDYFEQHRGELDEDSVRRLSGNPLRILDSKNPAMQTLIAGAPNLAEHLDAESAAHFARLRELLDAMGIAYTINQRLVRGLDYYSRTVFEWITDELGAQGTVCAGGRYDGLIEQMGGRASSAIGFAMGLERLVSLIPAANMPAPPAFAYLMMAGADAERQGIALAETWRDSDPRLRIVNHCGGGSLKNQFKKADKSGARIAIVIGDQELAEKNITIKYLRERREQESVPLARAADAITAALADH